MRFLTTLFLVVSLIVPAVEANGLLLFCTQSDRPPMPLDKCCCQDKPATPNCSPIQLSAQCCCEVHTSWQVTAEHDKALPASVLQLDLAALPPSFQEALAFASPFSSSIPLSAARTEHPPPLALYLLKHSFRI